MGMQVKRLRRVTRDWNALGEMNPYGAILTDETGALSAWDVDGFFATGEGDAAAVVGALSQRAPTASRRRALDFGCGVGRITRALAGHFDAVVGVDAAPA